MQETRAAMTANYDILIGSGIGALTVAVGLARQKHWRCLILEQNFNLGGMTQEFVRERRYHFDVGLHYVGEMNPGTLTRQLMDYVTGGAVEWAPMPDIFERFVYPSGLEAGAIKPRGPACPQSRCRCL
jgi:all-trans-retinol 13,14-reductase